MQSFYTKKRKYSNQRQDNQRYSEKEDDYNKSIRVGNQVFFEIIIILNMNVMET